MTLKDIAKEVGVSISTVSRVVNKNNPKAARPEIQKKIWDVIRKNGYIPNTAARELQKGNKTDYKKYSKISLVYGRYETVLSNPFFSNLAKHIEHEAFKNRYLINHILKKEDVLNYNQDFDGIIILGRFNQKTIADIKDNYKNVLYTGLNQIDYNIDQVICNGYNATVMAIKYLYKLGHRKIAYIGEKTNETRFDAYKDTVKQLNLKEFFSQDIKGFHSYKFGYRSACSLISKTRDFTAAFCANDETAIGFIKACFDNDIRVPEDFSVISIDNITTSQYIFPALTTVNIPTDELAKVAFQTLKNRIEKKHRLPIITQLPFYIVKRESCVKKDVIVI